MIASILIALTAILGDGVTTNVVIMSDEKETLGLSRQVVTGDQNNELHDNSGKIVQVAETAAVDEASNRASEISDAALAASNEAAEYLLSSTNNIAKESKSFLIAFAPEAVRSNVTGFVVKTTSDGTTDTQWVWYNSNFTQKPTRWVEYQGDYETQKVKAVWKDWTPAGVTVSHGGNTWVGCHECTLTRPAFAVGKSCVDLPNEIFGGENGFSKGDVNLTLDGQQLVTGVFTNRVNGKIETYDSGILISEEPYND